jgi:hypothetical protein
LARWWCSCPARAATRAGGCWCATAAAASSRTLRRWAGAGRSAAACHARRSCVPACMRCHSTLPRRLTLITCAARAHPRSLCPPPSVCAGRRQHAAVRRVLCRLPARADPCGAGQAPGAGVQPRLGAWRRGTLGTRQRGGAGDAGGGAGVGGRAGGGRRAAHAGPLAGWVGRAKAAVRSGWWPCSQLLFWGSMRASPSCSRQDHLPHYCAPPPAPCPAGHQYSEANLSFAHLKGRDREMAAAAAACPALEAHLALVTRKVVGTASGPAFDHRRAPRWRPCCLRALLALRARRATPLLSASSQPSEAARHAAQAQPLQPQALPVRRGRGGAGSLHGGCKLR